MTDAFAPLGAWYFPTIAFLFGACIGSFLNVCVSRWPADQSVVKPRSRCPQCGHEIPWYENIPLVSWLALRAKCSGCKAPISAVYPLLELTVGPRAGSPACSQFGPTLHRRSASRSFGTVLLGIMITDATDYVIPDGFTVFGFFFALVAAVVGALIGETLPFATLYDSVIGACVGAGAIAIIGWLGELALKKEAMGFGDVTLMAMVGAYLGPGRTLLTIFIGAFLGAVGFLAVVYPITWLRSKRAGVPFEPPLVPFGVFLAPAALIALLWGSSVDDLVRSPHARPVNFGDMLRSSADTLARFTRDLTAEARAGRLEPVRCRDDEIARVIDILLRHGKNNPALVGAAGTGKTAIAEGFAQRIAAGNVPFALRDARVLALDHAGLLAGTMYRGQYEERLTAIVERVLGRPEHHPLHRRAAQPHRAGRGDGRRDGRGEHAQAGARARRIPRHRRDDER